MPTGRCAVVMCTGYEEYIIAGLCLFGVMMIIVNILGLLWKR